MATQKPSERFAVCQNALRMQGMASDLDIALTAGVKAIGLLGPMVEATGLEATQALLNERSMVACSYNPGIRLLEEDEAAVDRKLNEHIGRAARLGASYILMVPGRTAGLTCEQADERFVRCLERAAPRARQLEILLGIEPVHPFLRTAGHIHTLRHAAELASRVPGTGVVFDCVHLFWDRDLQRDIQRHANAICAVQLANLDRAEMEAKRWSRSPIYDGIVPVADLVASLHAAGYRGWYEEETLLTRSRGQCIEDLRRGREWFEARWTRP